MRPASRDGFAVAIICALTIEAEAVEDLFDETYDRFGIFYGKQPGDDNAYINGRMGDHNVVLCYMPSMGKGNAASVASSLKVSYKRIQVALVVGICGGAPYPSTGREIFLGDVIISNAVVEYDFGRQYPGGFERKTDMKDVLGKPNREIRSMLAGLQARKSRIDLENKMIRHVQAIQVLEPDWRRPRSADDVLFESSYQHKHYSTNLSRCVCLDEASKDICKSALEKTCTDLGCDGNQIRRRRDYTESYSPRIHIGAVASADTVMKSGGHRDHLVKEEGVIGFEMEGAGVWDNISCIILKGVCDYADSHKNKAWQPYAAATGAATAKAFLEIWRPTVEEESNEFSIPLDLSAVPAVEEFIGRQDDLNQLWNYLQPASSRGRRVAVLYGLGGIGKTQLAIHFARKHNSDFTAIFWLSGKDQSTLVSSLSSCLPRIQRKPMDCEVTNEEEAKKRAYQVLHWLASPGNTRWLIIFDNIDQYSPSKNNNDRGYDIREFFPTTDHGSIIITSRLQTLTELGKLFPVQKLVQGDDMQLLLQSSGFSTQDITQAETEQDLTALLNQLDGLSLAIVLAGAFMHETGTSIKKYLHFYNTAWSDLQSQSEPTRHYQRGNILETWMITYKEIQKRDPTAAMLLLLLAYFDNQDIWYELIRCGLKCFSTPPWFKSLVLNELAFKAKIKILIGFSLIETKQQEGSYTIHPVVQDWCLHISTLENHRAQLYELALVSVGYMVPNREYQECAGLQQRLLPHANNLTQSSRHDWLYTRFTRFDLWDAQHRLGNLYSYQGKLKEAEKMYQQALAGYNKVLGPDHTYTLNVVNNLGNLYSNQDKLKEAEKMYQQALAGYKKALGPDHATTLDIFHNLGRLYHKQGKLREAEEIFQQVLASKKQVLDPDYTSTLGVVNNLGVLYFEQGKLKEAEGMYQQALAGYKKVLGSDHTSTLNTVHNLGNLYSHQGKFKEAEKIYQQVLAGYKKILGPDHIATLQTVNNIGNVYSDQGKLKEAEKMYQQVLASKKRVLGPDHTSTLGAVNDLGLLYFEQGKLKEAEKMHQQVLAGFKKALGPDHPSTLQTINNLGNLYSYQGKFKEAEEMYQQALAGYKKALGSDHISTLDILNNMGNVYSNQGKLKEAEEMYQQALAGYKKVLGSDHTSTLGTVHNLGIIYSKQGKLKEAEEMYQQALAGFKKALGPDHPSTLGTVHNLGNLYSHQGKFKEAEEIYQQALAGFKKVLGSDHTSTLGTVHSLGILYSKQGKLKEAEEMYQQALAGFDKMLGPDDPKTRMVANKLATLQKCPC